MIAQPTSHYKFQEKQGGREMKMRLIMSILMIATSLQFGGNVFAQGELAEQMAQLRRQRNAVASGDTQTRVPASYVVKSIALSSDHSEVKLEALRLLREPIGSSSDHIRMPAIYAVVDIANGSDDLEVERNALNALLEPMRSGQVPIRDVAIDALNLIMSESNNHNGLIMDALHLLSEPIDSGNNGVRMPAVHAILRVVEGTGIEAAYSRALDLLKHPIDSRSLIGGLEIRFMTIEAVERIAVEAETREVKRKAMELLRNLPDTDQRRATAAEDEILASF